MGALIESSCLITILLGGNIKLRDKKSITYNEIVGKLCNQLFIERLA